jgi:hypothetical protein
MNEPKTHDWIFSIGTFKAPVNADGSTGVRWKMPEASNSDSNSDYGPAKVAEDIAKHRGIQTDTLFCLTELATGKRYEVRVTATRVISYSVSSCEEVGISDTSWRPRHAIRKGVGP